jgi:hypothetical protein
MQNLLRSFAIALGLQRKPAICAGCGVVWPMSSPFIEGLGGLLFCRKCMLSTCQRAESESHLFSASGQHNATPETTIADQNPFLTPQVVDLPCALCGRETSGRDAITIVPPHAACRECLVIAERMIVDHERKEAKT